MRTPSPLPLAPLALALALAGAARAQDPPARADASAEVAELEALVARLDAALAALAPVERDPVTLELHDVRTLVGPPQDRPAVSLSLATQTAGLRTGEGGGAGAGSFCFDAGEEDPAGAGLSPDDLVALVTRAVGDDDAWESPRAVEVLHGTLLVRQTAVGHARVRQALAGLLERASTCVQLEVGFWGLSPAVREDLRRAALENDGVLPAAALTRLEAAAGEGARHLGATVITALDGQRVYLHEGVERAYVGEFIRSSGGTTQVAVVADPVIEVLRAGLVVDARPTLIADGDREVVALDVRFARCRVTGGKRRATPWGVIDVPQVETDAVRTSARVQAGGGMLVYSAEGADVKDDVTIVVRPRVVAPR